MTILEFQYLRHGTAMPDGYELANDLQGTHHGHFAVLVVKKEDTDSWRCPYCGLPDCKPIDYAGTETMSKCRQVSAGCCGDL